MYNYTYFSLKTCFEVVLWQDILKKNSLISFGIFLVFHFNYLIENKRQIQYKLLRNITRSLPEIISIRV